jgi:hypothetical protein
MTDHKNRLVTIIFLNILILLQWPLLVSVAKADTVKKWAVVVGVEGGGATHLDDDAQDFADVLQSVYGFPSNQTILLTNSQATKGAFTSALETVRDMEDNQTVVAIFISAHGDTDTFALYDGWMYGSELQSILAQYESPKMLVLINSCKSGSLLYLSNAVHGIVVTACNATELTYDVENFQNTVFVEYFVNEGMAQGRADSNGDGHVTVEEAFFYAEAKCNPPPGPLIIPRTHPQMADNYAGDMDLAQAVHAPWFTSLPVAVLIAVIVLAWHRKKIAQKDSKARI